MSDSLPAQIQSPNFTPPRDAVSHKLSTPHRQVQPTSKALQLQFQENPEDLEDEDTGMEINSSQSLGENEEKVTFNTGSMEETVPNDYHLQTSHAIAKL